MQSKPLIGITGKHGPFENVKNALKQIDLSLLKNKRILIKPNIGRVAKPEQGYNTHPLAIAGLIETLKELPVSKIAIGESPIVGLDTFKAFERGGITEIANKYNVELIDFDAVSPIIKTIPNPRILKQTKICAPLFEYDCLISVPVAKTHMHTVVTLGIKNMKGCLYRHEKVRYHQLEYIDKQYPEKTLDSAISDLATILLPDLTVIDGYIGMEGLGPSGGDAIKSDFCVASTHPFAADFYGCLLMGLDPLSVPHLRIISERMGFFMDVDSYRSPADYKEFIVPYRLAPQDISIDYKNIVVYDQESCSACLSTLMLFLRRFKDDMSPYFLDDGKFHIGIGKGIRDAKEGTVRIGNCSRRNMNGNPKTIYVPGCPPVPTQIYKAITGVEPEENEPEVS
ncbi:DUF362 domain-containing protein [candidate division KSB1 bacterium]|nr:DUF362 domain-containing protein [candidate division KSB1 bacterium]